MASSTADSTGAPRLSADDSPGVRWLSGMSVKGWLGLRPLSWLNIESQSSGACVWLLVRDRQYFRGCSTKVAGWVGDMLSEFAAVRFDRSTARATVV